MEQLGVPPGYVEVRPGEQQVAHQGPGARAVDEDVARLHQLQRLVAGERGGHALDGPGVAGLDQLGQPVLDDVELDEPTRPLLQERPQVGRDRAPVGQPGLELDRVVEGLDVLPVDRVLLVALDRVGDEVLGEGDHPGPGVLGAALVEADLLPLDLLQECGQQQPDRARADDVDPPFGALRAHVTTFSFTVLTALEPTVFVALTVIR